MNNTKSVTDLLDNINTSYMSEADKLNALAYAQRAEFIADVITGATNSAKKIVSIMKNLVPSFVQHA